MAQAIAEEISIKVTPQEQARLIGNAPIDPEAQDLYLHGILLRERSDWDKAVIYFSRAIDKNPSYAEAHSAFGKLLRPHGRIGNSSPTKKHLPGRKPKRSERSNWMTLYPKPMRNSPTPR